MVLGREGG